MTGPGNCPHRQSTVRTDMTVVVGNELLVTYECTDCGEQAVEPYRVQVIWKAP